MSTISLHEFKAQLERLSDDEVVVDVRLPSEYADGTVHIAHNIPLHTLHEHADTLRQYSKVYCLCASGNRSGQAQRLLTELGIQSMSVAGGMNMWQQHNFPVKKSRTAIPIMRQVLIAAGTFVLTGTLLAVAVHPYWLLLTGFVGAGLVFAGVTGICTMSTILSYMPWNATPHTHTLPTCNTGANTCCAVPSVQTTDEWHENGYTIKQFTNADLAHFSYAIISDGKMALVDPARDPLPYEQYAAEHNATIVAIFETHPHADFISGHAEIAKRTGATIYIHSLVGAEYEHTPFDDGNTVTMGTVVFRSVHTPGHSPDSVSIALETDGAIRELFSGDTLFVHDVGRPDLRESAGNVTAKREELAAMMYDTVTRILQPMADDVRVFPAHGAGSLCGKALGAAPYTTIGEERMHNPAFAKQTRAEFITRLTSGQPFIPKYFPHDVAINKHGAIPLRDSIAAIPTQVQLPEHAVIVDTRSAAEFRAGHYTGAINIPNGSSFSTWLGSILGPHESFFVVVQTSEKAQVLERIANIGYEANVLGILSTVDLPVKTVQLVQGAIDDAAYTVVDVRSQSEVDNKKLFANSVHIPLHELRERIAELPNNKPIAVHCAGGYRSAIGASIVATVHPHVYDVSDRITEVSMRS